MGNTCCELGSVGEYSEHCLLLQQLWLVERVGDLREKKILNLL